MTEDDKAALREDLQANTDLDLAQIRVVEQISQSDRTDYDLIGACVKMVIERAKEQERGSKPSKDAGGALLIFCSGVGEIKQTIDAIKAQVRDNIDVLPLHANLSPAEQRKVFEPQRASRRKVVVATNVAETSITIPEVAYVIDTGKVKEQRFEPQSGLSRLVECWASRAACKQRRGRAGRTREGECFKIFSRRRESDMAAQQAPEIQRLPLDNLCLQIKAMRGDEDVRRFLSKAIDPPASTAIDVALQHLVDSGALLMTNGTNGRLTPLGKHLVNGVNFSPCRPMLTIASQSSLPLDLRLGKILVLGGVLGCISYALTIAAIMSGKPLFTSSFEDREKASK